jgi:hypothetical protein
MESGGFFEVNQIVTLAMMSSIKKSRQLSRSFSPWKYAA